MRQSIYDSFTNAIAVVYDLPHNAIQKVNISTMPDECYRVLSADTDVANLIYNGIVEYAFDKNDPLLKDLSNAQIIALLTKLRYKTDADAAAKEKYGFYGEVMLYLMLQYFHHADTLISRGNFYLPNEHAETKGYDTYQMYQNAQGVLELWFGEVKFYQDYKTALKKIFDNIEKALSDKYLGNEFLTINTRKEHLDPHSEAARIMAEWEANPIVNIIDVAKAHNIVLVYPMLVIFDDHNKSYDDMIKEVVDHINAKYPRIVHSLTIPSKVFFMLLPVSSAKTIKTQVIQWIGTKAPLI